MPSALAMKVGIVRSILRHINLFGQQSVTLFFETKFKLCEGRVSSSVFLTGSVHESIQHKTANHFHTSEKLKHF